MTNDRNDPAFGGKITRRFDVNLAAPTSFEISSLKFSCDLGLGFETLARGYCAELDQSPQNGGLNATLMYILSG